MLLWQTWPWFFREDCGRTLELWARKLVQSWLSFSVATWKVMLRAVQMMEAWLMEIQRKAKTQLGLLREESGIWSAGNEELAAINKRPEPLRLKPLLCWDNGCWWVGAGESAVIKNKPASLRWNHLGCISSESDTEAVFQKWPRFYLMLTAKLGSVSSRWYWLWRHEGVIESSWSLALCGRTEESQ